MTMLAWQRERIAAGLRAGDTCRAIARRLGLSKNTVAKYRKLLALADPSIALRPWAPSGFRRIAPVPKKLTEAEMIAAFIAARGVTVLPAAPACGDLPCDR